MELNEKLAAAILIVDDDAPLVANLKDILEDQGYAVDVAYDGRSALEACQNKTFGLILVDIRLPDVGGVSLVEEMSQRCTEADFIVITGYASLDTAVEAVGQKKIVAYETKPLDIASLLALIKQVVVRKRTEGDLKKTEELYRLLAENAEDAVWTIDLDMRLTYISPSARRRLGFDAMDQAIPDLKKLLSAADFEAAKNIVRQAVAVSASGEDWLRNRLFEFEVTLSDGSKIWTETRLGLLWDGEGNTIGILGATRDTTERKKAREALREREARLVEAQRIARLGNWQWDLVTDETVWSDELFHIYGLSPARFKPSHQACLKFVHPDDLPTLNGAMDDALNEGQPYSIDYRIRRADGGDRLVHSEGEVTLDASGRPVRMAGTVHDITELKRTEEELRALSRRLVEIQESERRAIASELHDQIGQSLTALKLLVERLRQSPQDSLGWTEVKSLANELMSRVRNLSLDLRPSMLDDLGLLPTLLWHFDRFASQMQIKVDFRHAGL
ncbi:MAG: PAS domain S-box protein [Chloroflexi bacterium]|nr:PAS domain S-box protein [Chloroflexota bacterium]